MKIILSSLLFLVFSLNAYAQLKADSKVSLRFQDIKGEVNVNGPDALAMLEDYIVNKSTLSLVASEAEAEFIIEISVYEVNMGNRKGLMKVIDTSNDKVILESKLVKGTMNAFYGYSGSRHAIGILVKKYLFKEYKEIVKK